MRRTGTAPATKISRRELLKMASPLGKITLAENKCTGCGLCAVECPTGALAAVMEGERGNFRLLFRHGTCIACGQCLAACPEKCLSLERTVAPDKLDSPPEILFADEIVYCVGCGQPVATRAMMVHIKAKLPAVSGLTEAKFELCPECRVKQFSLPGK